MISKIFILLISLFCFYPHSLVMAALGPHSYKCHYSLKPKEELPYELLTPAFIYPNPQIGMAVAALQSGPRRFNSQHDRALSYLVFIDLRNPLDNRISFNKNNHEPRNLGQTTNGLFLENEEIKNSSGPAYHDEAGLNYLSELLKKNPLIERAIQDLDLFAIDMKLLARNHPALFQVILHSVLKHNHDIKIISHFINAIPLSWLKKTIGRSFLLDESKNSTIRRIANLLLQLGQHDLYTREHSMLVGLWSLKFYLYLAANAPEQFKELSHWAPVGHPIDVIGFLSNETREKLLDEKYIQITDFHKHPVTLVHVEITPDNIGSLERAIDYFHKGTIALLRSTSGPLETFMTDLQQRLASTEKGSIEKLLLLTRNSDLAILKKFNLSYKFVNTNHPLYISKVRINYDHYIKTYSEPLKDQLNRSLEILFWGASSHDVGKTEIPLAILNKRGKLDNEETAVMRSHALASFGRILDFLKTDPEYLAISFPGLLHHERISGLGYPLGLKGENMPLEARIMAIADSFHAMTSDRPYREGMSFEKAISILTQTPANNDVQWDPQLVNLFIEFIRFESAQERGR